jgi:hypothetical protein
MNIKVLVVSVLAMAVLLSLVPENQSALTGSLVRQTGKRSEKVK